MTEHAGEIQEYGACVIDAAYIAHQREWSTETFGPGGRPLGVLDHIEKELVEVREDPTDLGEWVDVIILAFDGAWRAGHEPQAILDAVAAKQARNEARTWRDWRTADPDKAIEHVPSSRDDAIRKVMADRGEPMAAIDVLDAIRERWPDAWPYASWLDIHEDMTNMFGPADR